MSPLKRHPLSPFSRRGALLLTGAVLWIAGCDTPPGPMAPVGSSSPVAEGPPQAAPSVAGSTVSGSSFREDFDGTALDEARWKAFKQSGVVAVQDGKLEVLNSNGNSDFPYVVTRNDVIPATGPYYFEMAYTFLTPGSLAFCLDYLPADSPAERPLTQPFMYTYMGTQDMKVRFAAEQKDVFATVVRGAELKKPHQLRVEFDGNRGYRVIANGAEILVFESARRPSKFWLGYPKDQPKPVAWGRVQVDYIEAGTLTAPASAKPLPTPTPSPSGSPSASPSV